MTRSLLLAFSVGCATTVNAAVFEEILSVQATKGAAEKPFTGNVSIPYTRVDVVIRDGIAVTRFLQTYHNHGASNEGFAVQQPLRRDTTITGFTLWDQGKRYVGAIEERATAELAYKEITGDEAPEMNRDPGLVRRTQNRYEMRVFPILPGEDKQIELISHERLGMESGRLICRVPLTALARPRGVASHTTDFSVLVTDELPMRAVNIEGVALPETVHDDHRRRYQARLSASQLQDAVVTIELAIPGDSHLSALTYNDGVDDYFSTRWLTRAVRPSVKPAATNLTGRTFYMGVWREDALRIGNRDSDDAELFGSMGLEMLAFWTLPMLDPGDEFHGSYQPPRYSGTMKRRKDFLTGPVVTSHKSPVHQFFRAFEETFEPAASSNASPVDVWEHLASALKPGDCSLAYLFLQGLSTGSCARLTEQIRRNPRIEFILVSQDDLPADLLQGDNVSYFNLARGWVRTSVAFASVDRQVLLSGDGLFDELSGVAGLETGAMQQFWSRLPNAGTALPSLRQTGRAKLRDVRLWRGPSTDGNWQVIWLSGRFNGGGRVRLELTGEEAGSFGRARNAASTQPLVGELDLPAGSPGNRFVSTFYGRQLTDALDSKIALLRQARRGVNRKELFAARQEIARLSKKFGFISSETAFIALPPELMTKYGFTPQEYAAQQIYDPAKSPATITPEPETWMLLALGLAVLGFTVWRRRAGQLPKIGVK